MACIITPGYTATGDPGPRHTKELPPPFPSPILLAAAAVSRCALRTRTPPSPPASKSSTPSPPSATKAASSSTTSPKTTSPSSKTAARKTSSYFSQQSDLPLTLGLMVDTSMSQGRVMDAERGASMQFLEQMFRENKDQVFLMQFDMTDPTAPAPHRLPEAPVRRAARSSTPPPARNCMNGGSAGTLLFDALVKASNEIIKPLQGRKALIVLSDGVDVGSDATVRCRRSRAASRHPDLLHRVLRCDLLRRFRRRHRGPRALTRLALETGGGFFSVSKKLSIKQIFAADRRRTPQPVQHRLRLRQTLHHLRIPQTPNQREAEGPDRPGQIPLLGPPLTVRPGAVVAKSPSVRAES